MRFRWAFLILCGALVAAAAAPVQAAVGAEELQRAADELTAARQAAAELDAGHREALREEAALKELLAELIGTIATVRRQRDEARRSATERIDEIYMRAGNPGADLVFAEDLTRGWVRTVYAGAVADVDREVIVALEASERDLGRVEDRLDLAVAEQQAVAEELAGRADEAAARLADAEAHYRRVRAEWEWEEEQRSRAEVAATSTTAPPATTSTTEAGPGAPTTQPVSTTTTAPTTTEAASTTTQPPATTTTTVPEPVPGGPFPAPVERWRSLVAAYFPADMVDDALSVMACESFGDPDITNPYSGAAGLFQHLLKYWPERAEGAGFPGASPHDPEANIAATWWLVERSLELGYDAWYFWTCKP